MPHDSAAGRRGSAVAVCGGVSLLEILAAAAVTASVMAGLLSALAPAQRMFAAQAEAVDATQRLRVAADTLARALLPATLAGPHPFDSGAGDAIAIRHGADRAVYYFAAGASQLRRVDGGGTDLPVVDGIVALEFAYDTDEGPLATAALSDGPWLPSAADPDRFDADLLAVRVVRVRIAAAGGAAPARVEVAVAPRNIGDGP